MPHKGAISNLKLRLSNPAIFHPEHKQPQVFGGNLHRMLDKINADEDQPIEVLVTEQESHTDHGSIENETSWGSRFIPAQSTNGTGLSNQNGSGQVEEVEKLKAEIQRLQKINKKLFEVSSHMIGRGKK